MRLFRAAAIVVIVAAGAAAAVALKPARAAADAIDTRTPQWLFEHGHFGEARAVAAARVARDARDAEALAWLARTYTSAGDPQTAVRFSDRAIAANPRYPGGHMALAEALGAEAERANVVRRLPLARRVKRALETAVALAPTDADALGGLLQFHLRAPAIAGGSDREAGAIAGRIAAISPARGFVAQGVIAAHRQDAQRVEALFLQAVAANPKSRHARMTIANFYGGMPDRGVEAETHAKALLGIDDALVTPYRVLAVVYARGKRWAELDDILARSDRQHPANLLASFAAAQALRETGADLPRAERYLRRYLSQPSEICMPTHAVAQWQLGLVLEKAGRRDEALAAVEQALRLDPALTAARADLERLGGRRSTNKRPVA